MLVGNISQSNQVKAREEQMVADAQKYGLDRAIAATPYGRDVQYRLSYDTEAMVLSKVVLEKLDQILHIVARNILQLPKSLARVGGALDEGLILMKDRVNIKLRN